MLYVQSSWPYAGPMQSSASPLDWPLMDRRRTNQLIELGRDIISTTVVMITGHCVMGRHKATSVGNAIPLRKNRLLSTFFLSVPVSR